MMTNSDPITQRLAMQFAAGDAPTQWQFILYGGLGDHVLWLSLLTAFRARASAPVMVYCDRRMSDLARLYADRAFDHLKEIDSLSQVEIDGLRAISRLAPGVPVVAWHSFHIGDETKYLANRDASMVDTVRQLLGLPADATVHRPLVPQAAYLAARLDITRLGLPLGRTVLLAPWAKSAQVILPLDWWAELAARLQREGYTVVTNTSMRSRGFDGLGVAQDAPVLPGTRGVDIPLRNIIPFAELCGTVVTARSGLSDLLAFSRVRHCVVWPYTADREAYFRKLFQIWSLRRLYPCHDVTEVHQEAAARFEPGPLVEWIHARPPPPGN